MLNLVQAALHSLLHLQEQRAVRNSLHRSAAILPQSILARSCAVLLPMSFEPGRANASSAAQPAAEEFVKIISAEQPVDPAAQPVQYPYSCCCLDVRWQVEHLPGQWWGLNAKMALMPTAALYSLLESSQA